MEKWTFKNCRIKLGGKWIVGYYKEVLLYMLTHFKSQTLFLNNKNKGIQWHIMSITKWIWQHFNNYSTSNIILWTIKQTRKTLEILIQNTVGNLCLNGYINTVETENFVEVLILFISLFSFINEFKTMTEFYIHYT